MPRLLVFSLLLLSTAAHAQSEDPVGPDRAAAPPKVEAPANCTDVQVGSAKSYECINAKLGAVARGQQRFSSDLNAPLTPNSPENKLGTFNEDATRERLGTNFGKSVTPQRPVTNYGPPPILAHH